MTLLFVILLVSCIFLAAILNLSLQSSFRDRVMQYSAGIAVFLGILFYSYTYTCMSGFSAHTVLRAVLMICRMFSGVNDFDGFRSTPLGQSNFLVTLFFLAHLAAFYVTASAAIEILGKHLLRRIRIALLRKGSLSLFYGCTPESIQFGRRYGQHSSLIYVVDEDNNTSRSIVESIRGILFSGGSSLCTTQEFLRTIGLHDSDSRQLDVYCMSENADQNLRYATAFLDAIRQRNISPDNTSLFLLGIQEIKTAGLMALGDQYGYGHVFASTNHELIARLLIRKVPPWSLLHFDRSGRATNNFHAVIVGFGQMGRSVLRHLVMNGQMEGSNFRADIFDQNMSSLAGLLRTRYSAMMEEYDILVHADSAQSDTFYSILRDSSLSMIILCTASSAMNRELALDIEHWYEVNGNCPVIIQCTPHTLTIGMNEYHLGDFDVRSMDRMAMIINHTYTNGPSEEIDWRGCDPFSRASSRASADFFPALLHASGLTNEEVLAGKWPPPPDVLENLAKSEHQRWCAFHLSMGYRPMSDTEFNERAARYQAGEKVRITKNSENMSHACIVPWDELDHLSEKEKAVTGKKTDYKSMDRNNVLAIPDMLRKERESLDQR
ncbi:MAG: hypothetical protein IJ088_05580 [Clostridia bacterium]|nr:hypothetical protein [Clostridia bacterium]